jgi:hypothetical protein
MNRPATYEEAKERVQQLKGFYQHLLAYVLINLFLFVVNLLTSRGEWWFYWPLFGWGIGLVAHGASVFMEFGPWGKAWEQRKIRELMGDRGGEDPPLGS